MDDFYRSINGVHRVGYDVFCERITEKLKEKDILYFYDSYEIYYTSLERCKILLSRFKNNDNENLIIRNFNNEFIKHIVQNAEKRQVKEIEKHLSKEYRKAGDYIASFKTLSELTIDNNVEKIKIKLSQEKIDKQLLEQLNNNFDFKIIKKHKTKSIEKDV